MEALADAVGLRGAGPGSGMLDVIDRQVQLVIMRLRLATVLGAPVRQDAKHRQGVVLEEGQHLVIQQVR